jgi:hypothetical protein
MIDLEWATPEIRVLAARLYCASRTLTIPRAQAKADAAWDAYIAAPPRQKANTRRAMLHARARLYAAILASAPDVQSRPVVPPPITPASEIADRIEQSRAYAAQLRYRNARRKHNELLGALRSKRIEQQEARTLLDKARAHLRLAQQAHEVARAQRRFDTGNLSAQSPTTLRVLQEARQHWRVCSDQHKQARREAMSLNTQVWRIEQALAKNPANPRRPRT